MRVAGQQPATEALTPVHRIFGTETMEEGIRIGQLPLKQGRVFFRRHGGGHHRTDSSDKVRLGSRRRSCILHAGSRLEHYALPAPTSATGESLAQITIDETYCGLFFNGAVDRL